MRGGILFSNEILSVKMLESSGGGERLTTFRLQGLDQVRFPVYHNTELMGLYNIRRRHLLRVRVGILVLLLL